jgi:CDP-4-dehydro-6-deoxyglucose reductase, E3
MVDFAKPVRYKATLITKKQLTDTVYFTQYQLIEPATLSFIAGQTLMLYVGENINRSMSIASPPQETSTITIIQDTSPMGPGSKWLLARNVGDIVEFMAPLGRFTMDHQSPRKRVFIATGTGIAPFRCMLLDETENAIYKDKPLSFYWGVRYEKDVYLQDEIQSILSVRPNMKYTLVLSQPADTWQGTKGHVNEAVLGGETDMLSCDFYLCGNKMMIADMLTKLAQMGVPKEHIHNDPYY